MYWSLLIVLFPKIRPKSIYINHYSKIFWPKNISLLYIDHYCFKKVLTNILLLITTDSTVSENYTEKYIYRIYWSLLFKKVTKNISNLITTVLKQPSIYVDRIYWLLPSESDQWYTSTNIYTSSHQIIQVSRYQPN